MEDRKAAAILNDEYSMTMLFNAACQLSYLIEAPDHLKFHYVEDMSLACDNNDSWESVEACIAHGKTEGLRITINHLEDEIAAEEEAEEEAEEKAIADPTKEKAIADLKTFVNNNVEQFFNLRARWQDEKQYEDIKGYSDILQKLVEDAGYQFLGLTKGFVLTFYVTTNKKQKATVRINMGSIRLLLEK